MTNKFFAEKQKKPYLYFQKQDMQGNAVLHRYNLNSQSSEAITAVTAQGKLRYADSLLYIMHDSKIEVLAHTDNEDFTTIPVSTINASSSFRYSGISSSSAIGMHGSLTYGYNGDTHYRCLAKQYELKDHLGNVRVVISDVKEPNATYDQFTATLQSYYNYYAFGMLQPNRHYTLAEEYKFGFNGKEMENDWNGKTGAVYDYGFRIYDARIAKFLSVDPLFIEYPELTTYQFASNTPIWAIDLDGLEARYTNRGKFIGWGELKGDDAPVQILVVRTEVIKNGDNQKIQTKFEYVTLTINGLPITHSEFEQMAAIVYNETFNGTNSPPFLPKQQVADAIYNRHQNMSKMYPSLKESTIQKTIDRIAYGADTKEKRLSEERIAGLNKIIPGTSITYNNIRTKHYARFINTKVEMRNDKREMLLSNLAAIMALSRDTGEREEDTVNGAYNWRGDGTQNNFYKEKKGDTTY